MGEFDNIYGALEAHNRQWERERESKRAADSLILELEQQRNTAINGLVQGLQLQLHAGATLQQAVDAALHAASRNLAESLSEAERLRVEVATLKSRVLDLETDQAVAVDQLVTALELPSHRTRGLSNAVAEVITMIVDAKKMVRENL